MDRPLMDLTIDQLEAMVLAKPWDRFQLSRVREEVTYRRSERARQLQRDIEARLDGTVPMPPKPESADDQREIWEGGQDG